MNDNARDAKERLMAEFGSLFDATDEALSAWQGEGNLQFPHLLTTLTVKLKWDEKTMRENDPIVRKIVRSHPDWYVTRGAHGGIMRATEKQKKDAVKAAKDLAKKQLQEAIDAKVAAQSNPQSDSK